MDTLSQDLYATLSLSRDSDRDRIRAAYLELARVHHPDVNPDTEQSRRRFQRIRYAYEVLSDPVKRQLYDASIGYLGSSPKFDDAVKWQATASSTVDTQSRHDRANPFWPEWSRPGGHSLSGLIFVSICLACVALSALLGRWIIHQRLAQYQSNQQMLSTLPSVEKDTETDRFIGPLSFVPVDEIESPPDQEDDHGKQTDAVSRGAVSGGDRISLLDQLLAEDSSVKLATADEQLNIEWDQWESRRAIDHPFDPWQPHPISEGRHTWDREPDHLNLHAKDFRPINTIIDIPWPASDRNPDTSITKNRDFTDWPPKKSYLWDAESGSGMASGFNPAMRRGRVETMNIAPPIGIYAGTQQGQPLPPYEPNWYLSQGSVGSHTETFGIPGQSSDGVFERLQSSQNMLWATGPTPLPIPGNLNPAQTGYGPESLHYPAQHPGLDASYPAPRDPYESLDWMNMSTPALVPLYH